MNLNYRAARSAARCSASSRTATMPSGAMNSPKSCGRAHARLARGGAQLISPGCGRSFARPRSPDGREVTLISTDAAVDVEQAGRLMPRGERARREEPEAAVSAAGTALGHCDTGRPPIRHLWIRDERIRLEGGSGICSRSRRRPHWNSGEMISPAEPPPGPCWTTVRTGSRTPFAHASPTARGIPPRPCWSTTPAARRDRRPRRAPDSFETRALYEVLDTTDTRHILNFRRRKMAPRGGGTTVEFHGNAQAVVELLPPKAPELVRIGRVSQWATVHTFTQRRMCRRKTWIRARFCLGAR